MVELSITMTLLIVSALGFSQLILSSRQSSELRREQTLAMQTARGVLEQIKGAPFDEVFARYNANGTLGDDFVVPGLHLRPGDVDGAVGEIVFPVQAGSPGVLREDLQDVLLGTPLDLDRDGNLDGADHAGDYRLLPVLVRVRWRSASGPAEIAFRTILTDL